MTIGILRLVLFIQDSNSLKGKRMAIDSLKSRLRTSFNLAVTQIDDDDKWQKATLVLVGVEKNRQGMNSTLSAALNFIEQAGNISLIDHEMELI